MLQSVIKGLVSNDTVNECIDFDDVSEDTLVSAKDKLLALMEKMKRITSDGVSSPFTIKGMKEKISAQINRIALIEKYLFTKNTSDQCKIEVHPRHNSRGNVECLQSNVSYQALHDPEHSDMCNSYDLDIEDSDSYDIMRDRRNSLGAMIWGVFSRFSFSNSSSSSSS
eukprot:111126_1